MGVRCRERLSKLKKGWNSYLAIEDPFELSNNLAGTLGRKGEGSNFRWPKSQEFYRHLVTP